MAPAAGYSGKPLWQKLGFKPGMVIAVVEPPDTYDDLVSGCDGVVFDVTAGRADIVHLFCRTRTALEAGVQQAPSRVVPGGMLWVSWPKKSSKLFVDLTEDTLREVILPTGWIDTKVCAVDADWSGLKFLRRKADRA